MNKTEAEQELKQLLENRIWKKLSKVSKEKLISRYVDEYNNESETVRGTIIAVKQYYFNFGLVALGLILGIVGNFFVNAFERLQINNLNQQDPAFNLVIMAICLIVLFYIFWKFISITEDILRSNKFIKSLFDEKD